ncbi:MAG: GntR family transcriptional regulator [Oscillospiraceae bacterium]|nr:GntR family transcriptional regulator [Oscillospiraceae bacterium]
MKVTKRQPNEPAREYAYREICRNIVSLELPPGTEISVQKIAEELGISRTPVREAFLQLQAERILEIKPQSGSYVARVDFHLVNSSRFVRLALERAVVEEVCRAATADDIHLLENSLELQSFFCSKNMFEEFLQEDNYFHCLFYRIAGREDIQPAGSYLAIHFNRVRTLWMNICGPDNTQRLLGEHKAIIDAIRERDAEKAQQALSIHLSDYSLADQQRIRECHPMYFHM